MPGIIVVGLQWGDEGKGKVVDLFSRSASHVVRSQGGSNSGHTVHDKGDSWTFHQIPSGILRPSVHCYIAGGCAIDPRGLIREMQDIESRGFDIVGRLHLSSYAHLVFPHHYKQATAKEESTGKTKKEVDLCLSDRSSRIGIRLAELIRPEIFEKKIAAFVSKKNKAVETDSGVKKLSAEKIANEYASYGELLRPFVSDVECRLQKALIRDDTVLFEGADGTLLDNVMGSYPYVASFSTIAAGVCVGAGVGPSQIDDVFGVLKAYTTRLDEGPLPTAIEPDYQDDFSTIEELRGPSANWRIGWLDLVAARHAIGLNGIGNLILTKLDALDAFSEIKVCTGYELNGKKIDRLPPLVEDLGQVEPIYEVFPGWQCSTRKVDKVRALPGNARAFVEAIEEFCNVPITMISVGPERDQTIEIDEEWM